MKETFESVKMDIVERNSLINSGTEQFEDETFQNTTELSLKALRINNPKIPHSEYNSPVRSPSCLPEISLEEVANHDHSSDCWIVVYDRVYNVTKFLESHPGGHDVILDYAGRDATLAFRGTGHSKEAIKLLAEHLIGELPEDQRIFRRQTDFIIQLSDMPQ